MVESIVRHWKHQMAPLRHLQLLAGVKDDMIADEDENWIRRTKSFQRANSLHPLQECLPVEHPEAILPEVFPEE